jgi:ferredoxin
VHHTERVVQVSPLRHGFYAAPLQKAAGRLRPLISPFFRKARDMTHYALRCQHRARCADLACDETPPSERARLAVFESADGEPTRTLRPGDTLLDAALNAGIALPFSCCSGSRGACRVYITAPADHVVLDEPNTGAPKARSPGQVPACLVRRAGPCRFRLP